MVINNDAEYEPLNRDQKWHQNQWEGKYFGGFCAHNLHQHTTRGREKYHSHQTAQIAWMKEKKKFQWYDWMRCVTVNALTHHFDCFGAIEFIPFGVCNGDAKHQNDAEQLSACGSFADGESPKDDDIAQKQRCANQIHKNQKVLLGQQAILQPEAAPILYHNKNTKKWARLSVWDAHWTSIIRMGRTDLR